MNSQIIETHPFKPFIPANAKILMLGTFPPKPERWSMDFFYPNKINDMWRIMGSIFYNDKDRFWNDKDKKFILNDIKEFLNVIGLALYDTGFKVRRLKDNASDKYLEIIECADIKKILSDFPTITAIITAGEKATETLSSMFGSTVPKVGESSVFLYQSRSITHYRAPSSSRAYPLSLEKKALAYSSIFKAEGYNISKKLS